MTASTLDRYTPMYLEGGIIRCSTDDADYLICIGDHWVTCASYAEAVRLWNDAFLNNGLPASV